MASDKVSQPSRCELSDDAVACKGHGHGYEHVREPSTDGDPEEVEKGKRVGNRGSRRKREKQRARGIRREKVGEWFVRLITQKRKREERKRWVKR